MKLLAINIHDPEELDRAYNVLLPLYKIADDVSAILGTKEDFDADGLKRNLGKLRKVKVSNIYSVCVNTPTSKPSWMTNTAWQKSNVLAITESIGLSLGQSLERYFNTKGYEIQKRSPDLVKVTLRETNDRAKFWNLPQDNISEKIHRKLKRVIVNSISAMNPKGGPYSITGTIWEEIIRGHQLLLYYYIACFLDQRIDEAHILGDIIKHSYKSVLIGEKKEPGVAKEAREFNWIVLVESK